MGGTLLTLNMILRSAPPREQQQGRSVHVPWSTLMTKGGSREALRKLYVYKEIMWLFSALFTVTVQNQ